MLQALYVKKKDCQIDNSEVRVMDGGYMLFTVLFYAHQKLFKFPVPQSGLKDNFLKINRLISTYFPGVPWFTAALF